MRYHCDIDSRRWAARRRARRLRTAGLVALLIATAVCGYLLIAVSHCSGAIYC